MDFEKDTGPMTYEEFMNWYTSVLDAQKAIKQISAYSKETDRTEYHNLEKRGLLELLKEYKDSKNDIRLREKKDWLKSDDGKIVETVGELATYAVNWLQSEEQYLKHGKPITKEIVREIPVTKHIDNAIAWGTFIGLGNIAATFLNNSNYLSLHWRIDLNLLLGSVTIIILVIFIIRRKKIFITKK